MRSSRMDCTTGAWYAPMTGVTLLRIFEKLRLQGPISHRGALGAI